ncbi:MAG: hypothetical protein A3F54_04740 [Candidatus Kerfeldbacteria bacterium RIFCSPHIGHO2_12_FULL_48_17]|uniref:RNA polymerase subunit sigma-24 n=1 Tax=Candidatus Kerfeldbacteria bacterium RIFCSPHIGHO2_12_FULL_48_17 TaxID=1798542 RepID=A0A1G2AZH5_9BACT|nr:MAG: hypothetical protein A3F54_04740 [Candidatus Kerfeldbacteria bacterium RIFCSPHIGHO2_12_FULL_48_17]
MLDKQAEQELVTAAQSGDENAIITLYDVYLPAIYRFLFAQTGNKEDAEDIAQDTLTEAFRSLKKFRGQARFKNWLYQIAKFKLADWWRAKYKQPIVPLEDFCPVATQPDMFFDEDHSVLDNMKQDQIQKILEDLPDNYKRVLEYRFLKNFSLKETAIHMNTTEGNIKVMQFRALKKAAQLFSPTL